VNNTHSWLKTNGADFLLNSPRQIAILMSSVRKKAIEPTN
jgi:hypothetical protein